MQLWFHAQLAQKNLELYCIAAARASLFVNLVNILNFLLQSWPALPKANNRKGCWHKSNRGPLLVHLLIEEKCHTLQPGIGRQRIQPVTAPEALARQHSIHRAYHPGPNNHSGNWLLFNLNYQHTVWIDKKLLLLCICAISNMFMGSEQPKFRGSPNISFTKYQLSVFSCLLFAEKMNSLLVNQQKNFQLKLVLMSWKEM